MAPSERGNCFVLLLCLCSVVWTGQASQLPLRTFTTADGLPSNRVSRIVRDARGYLWFCTRDGLSRYDGYQFTNFGVEQGLPLGSTDLLPSQSGAYWVATSDGVARFDTTGRDPLFTVFRPEDPGARRITALADDGAGGLWCGTMKGLYRLVPSGPASQQGVWTFVLVDIGLPNHFPDDHVVTALLRDRSGTIWAASYSGLYRSSVNGTWTRYTTSMGLPNLHVSCLLLGRDGHLWVGTWYGLCRISLDRGLNPHVEGIYHLENGWHGDVIFAVLESLDGTLWVGTGAGLSKLTRTNSAYKIEKIGKANGLAELEIADLAEDSAGNLWVASSGVVELIRGGFTRFGTEDGLDTAGITSIFEDQKGDLCATSGDAAGRIHFNWFNGKRFHALLPNLPSRVKNWGWGGQQIMFQDHSGSWWLATGQGLFRYSPASGPLGLKVPPTAVYDARHGLRGGYVYRLFEDSSGNVWISLENELAVWQRRQSTLLHYSVQDVLGPFFQANGFAEDRAKNLWISFGALPLLRISQGRLKFFHLPKGTGTVTSLYLDQDGRLWGACTRGLLRIDSPEQTSPELRLYGTADGLASSDVGGVTQDQWGRLYVSTGQGVDAFYPTAPFRITHYTKADGVAEDRPPMMFRDRTGTLWFGNAAGLTRLIPLPDETPTPPPVAIDEMRVRGVRRVLSALGEGRITGIELAASQNQLEVAFVGLEFRAGKKLNYQYQLEGADTGWSTPTNERRVNYASLAPGHYRFLVRAISSEGFVSEKPASLAFTIVPPVWRRTWALILMAMAVGGSLYGLYRYRLEHLLAVERVRARIATDLHDDIGSTLSQISILSEVASRGLNQQQAGSLQEIANLSRESVGSMSDIVWAIDPEQDRLEQLARRMRRFASDLSLGNGVQIRVSAPLEDQDLQIGSDVRRQLFLIFKESLHNAIRHSAGKHVDVNLGVQNGQLTLSIQDDGRGFDPKTAALGRGLISIEQRACVLHGKAEITSAPGQGTMIRVEIPLTWRAWRPWTKPRTNG